MSDSSRQLAALHRTLLPEGWPQPRGFAHGVLAAGRCAFLGGQIGADPSGAIPDDFVAQARIALENILAVLSEAGGRPEHLARLTWYVRDIAEYKANLKPLGSAYRAVIGAVYPAMTLVQISGLVEPAARLEIEATAVLPESSVGAG